MADFYGRFHAESHESYEEERRADSRRESAAPGEYIGRRGFGHTGWYDEKKDDSRI